MADLLFNIAKGRVIELVRRVLNNDPPTSGLTVVALNSTAADDILRDLDTLAAVIADGNTAEVDNTGYARFDVTDSIGGLNLQVDDTNNWVRVDMDDITFTTIAAGIAWTDILICYNPNVTAHVDANIVPLCMYELPITPDGSNIVVQIGSGGWFRAS